MYPPPHRGRGRRGASFLAVVILAGAIVGTPAPADAAIDCTRDPFTESLVAVIESRWPNNRVTAEVVDMTTGCRYSLNRENRQTTASVIKISIMAAVLLRAQDEGRSLTEWERGQIGPMIRESDNPTASRLWVYLGGAVGMQRYLDRFGLTETIAVSPKWGGSLTSASDQVHLISALILGGGPLDAHGRDLARGFLLDVAEEQRWGATAGVPPNWSVALKNGFYPSSGRAWRINTVGLVEDPARPRWALAVLTDGWATESAGIEAAEYIVAAITRSMLSGRVPPFGRRIRAL